MKLGNGVAVASTAALLATVGYFGRPRPELGLLWLGFAGVALLALESALRGARREVVGTLLVVLGGIATRLLAESGPANWYVDILAPASAEGYAPRRAVGFAHTYRLLADWLPIGETVIYGVSVVSSSVGLALLWRALFGGAGREHWPRGTAWIWAALICTFPPIVMVGASDAVQNVALLSLGVAAWLFRRALDSDDERARRWPLVGVTLAAGITGMTRPEWAHAPLLLPLLVLPAPRGGRRWLGAAAALGVGCVAGLSVWAGQHVGVAWTAAGVARLGEWLSYVVQPLVGAEPGCEATTLGGPVVWSEGQAWAARVVVSAALVAAALGLWRRRWGPALAAPAYLLSALPSAFTGAFGLVLGCRLVTSRYTMFTSAILFLSYCAGAALAVGWLARWGRAALVAGLVLVTALVGWLWVPTTMAPATEPYPHRIEHARLREAVNTLPVGAVIYELWGDHFPSRRDPDAALAPGHPLLSFARPDIRWVILSPGQGPEADCANCYYYRGAMCDLDAEVVRRESGDEDAAFVEALRRSCDEDSARVQEWLFFTIEEVAPWHWPTIGNRVGLGLGRL